MKEYKIASIAGDGIGKEVVPEGIKILKKVAEQYQFKIHFDEFDFASCDYYCWQQQRSCNDSSDHLQCLSL